MLCAGPANHRCSILRIPGRGWEWGLEPERSRRGHMSSCSADMPAQRRAREIPGLIASPYSEVKLVAACAGGWRCGLWGIEMWGPKALQQQRGAAWCTCGLPCYFIACRLPAVRQWRWVCRKMPASAAACAAHFEPYVLLASCVMAAGLTLRPAQRHMLG